MSEQPPLPGAPAETVVASPHGGTLRIPTPRLTLEGVAPDAAAGLRAGGDGGFAWLGGAPFEGTRDVSGMLTQAHNAGVYRPEFGMFALVRRDDGLAIGSIAFHGPPDDEGRVEIGYDLVEAARGNGYATEAVDVLTAWTLARDDVGCVCATVEETNTASQNVLHRAGFTRTRLNGDELLLYIRSRG
ncbi:GNAT family N-acetyltransferase [Streptomyces sp. NPDC002134]|uniref:GNAT family N-acetyltransferase n=1 Tax=Streptomyces sp. NPDC002134 TaxID=3364632 RepID=UPI0036888E39